MLNIRILVVDDHGTLRKRIADYLRAQEGVEEVAEAFCNVYILHAPIPVPEASQDTPAPQA